MQDFVQINFGHKSGNLGSATRLKVVSRLQYNSRRGKQCEPSREQQRKGKNRKKGGFCRARNLFKVSDLQGSIAWQNTNLDPGCKSDDEYDNFDDDDDDDDDDDGQVDDDPGC